MKYPVFTIKDQCTWFWQPFVADTEAAARREFGNMICNGSGAASFRPGDFDLYRIGEFDSEEGTIVGETSPKWLVNGQAFKVIENDE